MNRRIVSRGILVLVILATISIPTASAETLSSLPLQELRTDEEFKEYMGNLSSRFTSPLPEEDSAGIFSQNVMREASPMPVGAEMKSSVSDQVVTDKSVATDYSTTNIQVAGVDEADFVKNDGKYIYIISKNTLFIVQAYPPQSATVIAREPVSGSVSELFLNGDRLVVFSSQYGYSEKQMVSDIYYQGQGETTTALIYDITDRSHPQKIREVTTPGIYGQARLIGGDVYLLTSEKQRYNNPRMPVIFDDSHEIRVGSVWCPPFIVNEYQMNTLTSFPLTGSGTPQAVSFLLGWDTTLYVSSTDVFIAYGREDYRWSRPQNGQGFMLEEVSSLPGEESVIHRFTIDHGSIRYKSTGTVPGSLLNQFSLDQFEGNLRVATTAGGNQYSNVYVLNPDLDIIGKLEYLAPGEKIYSARFMDEILYLVTFRQTDPLFVIDLSNPNNPGILGKLKMPGYSDYLHPYDRTHLIGIGKDTYENSGGGVIPAGIKIALFDISDLKNPMLVDSRVIGEKGSESAVLTDHRAFLLDKERNILTLPVKEVIHAPVTSSRYQGSYTDQVWQGTYVFGVDPEKGFYEKGKVIQSDTSQDNYYTSGSAVLRSLFMDQVLYTISPDRIVGSDLEDLSRRLMEIDLTKSSEQPWYLRPLWETLGE